MRANVLHSGSEQDDKGASTIAHALGYSAAETNAVPQEPYRKAIVLTELEGLTQKELAERLGISLSGAKSRVQRRREQLKQALFDCCKFEFDRRGRVIDCAPRSPDSREECG